MTQEKKMILIMIYVILENKIFQQLRAKKRGAKNIKI
jgi:uncharacterized membrane protein SirB2